MKNNKVSNAALKLLDTLSPYVHKVHYLIDEFEKAETYKYINKSAGHTRKLLNELNLAGYIAYIYLGPHVKLMINPLKYRLADGSPNKYAFDLFRQHERLEAVNSVE